MKARPRGGAAAAPDRTATGVTASAPARSATSAGGPFGGSGQRAARSRSQGPPRRHPHGGAAAAGRGAAQRLPDHAGGGGAQRRRLATEPRLGLPGARAARGRGPDPLGGDRGAQAVRAHRRRTQAFVQERGTDKPAPWEQMSGEFSSQAHELGQADARGRVRLRAGDAHRQRGPGRQGPRRARRRPPRPLPDSRRRRGGQRTLRCEEDS